MDTSKADDESSDDDVMLSSASRNSQSDEVILTLFPSDTKESDFSSFQPRTANPS